ncbi:histone acetyltransferase-1 [Coleophoma crateriformis]|uniref:Histone acetyltransferase n=1 Tax=Coleophoma crateriformis TaxID=565419 RepID=A0A3D8T7B6_9HELO|nr:histone acetyltransferase-1 [Coleophoma crateriformis]
MAAEVLMQEELHRSMETSEEDAEFEEDDELGTPMMEDNEAEYAANAQLHNGLVEHSREDEATGNAEDEEDAEEGEEGLEDDEDDALTDEDAEGEEDEDAVMERQGDEEEDEDEDPETAGAVKIIPGQMADDDEDAMSRSSEEEEEDFAASGGEDEDKDSTDAEAELDWEANAADEEEELTNPNRCIFCYQDEENDPSEEFEMYLTCDVCADNSHRQCARDAGALEAGDEAETWRCPNCVRNQLEPAHETEDAATTEGTFDSTTRRVSSNRIAGDLLPSQRGSIKPDSHSVFNTLIAPDDPLDGSRFLRRRKSSAADVDADEATILRRRTRDKEVISNIHVTDSHIVHEDAAATLDAAAAILTNGIKKDESISPRTSRSLRPKPSQPPASLLEKTATSIRVVIRLDPVELRHIQSVPPKPKKKKASRSNAAHNIVVPSVHVHHSYTQPFYALHDKEIDEFKSKPYGGILADTEAETTNTLPKPENRKYFDEARQKSEAEWQANVTAAAATAVAVGMKRARKVSGPASQIEYIEFGANQIDIWYAAPYPEEYSRNKALFICEFCLKYMESPMVAWRHKTKCPWKQPPGDEIYREGKISMFEVDGRKNPLYCQNLCLLAKLFLGSKTLYYDVEPFLFYVMTEYDDHGYHFVGYFSKEKRASSLNNVSCILVLPIHQRKGYGHLLIDFSYLLTRHERKTGSPEKPLSDMGLVSYRNYWRLIMSYYLGRLNPGDSVPSIQKMADETGMTPDDIVSALEALGAVIRDPLTGTYAIKLKSERYDQVVRQHEAKARHYAKLNPRSLTWTPFIMGRGNASYFELAPPLNTVAPREDEEDLAVKDPLSTSKKRDFAELNGASDEVDPIANPLGMLPTTSTDYVKSEGSTRSGSTLNGSTKKTDYYEVASNIPATRFEVFPSVPGARKSTVNRNSVSRARSGLAAATPTPNRNSGGSSSRRASSDRPSSRRKSTGRGPGRWPKGSKKSDFGLNNNSGPGLAPRSNKRSRLGQEVVLGEGEDHEHAIDDGNASEEDEDAILYETPDTRKRNSRSTGRGLGKPPLGKPSGKGKGKPGSGGKSLLLDPDGDAEMGEFVVGDLDAEGEDE